MKAEDLMIGDWIYLYDTPCRVKDIVDDGVINYEKDVTPISLTKEVLKKNSFWGDVYLWLDVGDEKTLEYYPFEHRLSLYYSEGKSQELLFRCQCFYVHEFQHALKMCGIEKEIIL